MYTAELRNPEFSSRIGKPVLTCSRAGRTSYPNEAVLEVLSIAWSVRRVSVENAITPFSENGVCVSIIVREKRGDAEIDRWSGALS